MRLVTVGGAAAIAFAGIVAGCSDQPDGTRNTITSPLAAPRAGLLDGASFRIHGAGSVSIRTANGVIARAVPGWSAAGSVRDGVAKDESGSPLGVIAMSAALVKPGNAGVHRSDFTDAAGNQISVVWAGGTNGEPMRGLRHYVNGQLLMAVDYAWAPVAGGWVLKSVDRRVLRDGKVAAVLHVGATGPAEVAARGVVSDVLAHLGAAAAHAVTPRELDAQVFSGPCRTQALNYYAAQAALTAAILALENNPSPLTAALVVAASAHAITAEMAYWLCQENVDSKNTPLGGKGNAGPMPSVPLLPCEMNWATCETPEIQ